MKERFEKKNFNGSYNCTKNDKKIGQDNKVGSNQKRLSVPMTLSETQIKYHKPARK